MDQIKTVGGVNIYQDGAAILFKAGATINGDGSPHCYHPDEGKGLDYLANAGSPGNWWGIATDAKGHPIVQSIYDVAPGNYVSTTALTIPGYSPEFPEHYLDSERYPFMVVPGSFGYGWKVGDVGFCYNERTNDNMYCCTGDVGPSDHVGEVSMLLGRCLGLNVDPKKGGCESGIVYVAFPASDPLYRPWREKCQIAQDVFNKWGGMEKLKQLIPKM
jgi:Fungal chitosanase of glycosyl hydrolase group 75